MDILERLSSLETSRDGQEVTYASDISLRKQLFTPESFKHPAKMHLGLLWSCILQYSKYGDTILDPMAGTGSLMVAALAGRNVTCVELEKHFVEIAEKNQKLLEPHTTGKILVTQGDARYLHLPKIKKNRYIIAGQAYLGNTPTVIISSPPYESSVKDSQEGPGAGGSESRYGRWRKDTANKHGGYSQPISSPLYEGSANENQHNASGIVGRDPSFGYFRYTTDDDNVVNVGNQRGQAYWNSMSQIYTNCYDILPAGGKLVLVVKGYTRKSAYVDLPQQTIDLCVSLGFRSQEVWWRRLTSLSFWRTLQKKTRPESWDERLEKEYVLVFSREYLYTD